MPKKIAINVWEGEKFFQGCSQTNRQVRLKAYPYVSFSIQSRQPIYNLSNEKHKQIDLASTYGARRDTSRVASVTNKHKQTNTYVHITLLCSRYQKNLQKYPLFKGKLEKSRCDYKTKTGAQYSLKNEQSPCFSKPAYSQATPPQPTQVTVVHIHNMQFQ